MIENNDVILNFLQQQVTWCKEQDEILTEIESRLLKMKALAQYRRNHDLPRADVQYLNKEMQDLEAEVIILNQRLYKGTVHWNLYAPRHIIVDSSKSHTVVLTFQEFKGAENWTQFYMKVEKELLLLVNIDARVKILKDAATEVERISKVIWTIFKKLTTVTVHELFVCSGLFFIKFGFF